MSDFEKALNVWILGFKGGSNSPSYWDCARWAHAWMLDDDNNWALYKAKNREVKKLRTENAKLRDALEPYVKIDICLCTDTICNKCKAKQALAKGEK